MKPKLVFILLVLFQLLILVVLVVSNEVVLATGKTVVLQTVPVDPRDIFRGDYVALRYEISTLSMIPGLVDLKEGDKVYVHLESQGDVWEATEVSKANVDEWLVVITGEVTSKWNHSIDVKYGIEAYFVPEDKGLEIQNADDIKVRVSVDSSGKAVIKNLIVDGETFQLQ